MRGPVRSLVRRIAAVALAASLSVTLVAHAKAESTEASRLAERFQALLGRPGGLTAEQAARRARSTSNEVDARRADSAVARTRVDQAAFAFAPKLTARGAYTRISDIGFQSFGNLISAAPGTPVGPVTTNGQTTAPLNNAPLGFFFPNDNYVIHGEVTLPISDYVLRLANQYAGAKHSVRAAELTTLATELTASSNARLQYYAWARARLQEIVAASARDLAGQHVAEARSRFATGRASPADLMQFEARMAERELLLSRARGAVAVEEDRLRTMLHDAPAARYEIGEPLLADLPPVPAQDDLGALLGEAYRQRPEVRAIEETAAGLHADASAQRIALWPRLDAFASATYANPNLRYFPPPPEWRATWALGAAITWTSTDAIAGGTNAGAAAARATGAEAQARAIRDGIREEVVLAYQGLHDAESAITSSQRGLTAAEEAYRVRRSLFDADQATSTELADAENALLRARFEAVTARIDLRIARVRLGHAAGRDAALR